jgi:adenylate kinase
MNFLIMGPPGAGKGTQAKILAEKYNLMHLSTGDMLRHEIDNQSDIGLKAKNYMNQGFLVPDDVLLSIMENTLTSLKGIEIILDGFPRTIPQAEGLEAIFQKLDLQIDYVINVHVDGDILINRLINRAKNSGRRDDTEEVIINRQKVYSELTAPLIQFYKNQLLTINGDGTVEEVTQRILDKIQ